MRPARATRAARDLPKLEVLPEERVVHDLAAPDAVRDEPPELAFHCSKCAERECRD